MGFGIERWSRLLSLNFKFLLQSCERLIVVCQEKLVHTSMWDGGAHFVTWCALRGLPLGDIRCMSACLRVFKVFAFDRIE